MMKTTFQHGSNVGAITREYHYQDKTFIISYRYAQILTYVVLLYLT
jgi:hypothetical protein